MRRILIVDDEPAVRDTLRLVLERAGYEVRGVGDGASALDTVRWWEPHLVLTDLNLPGRGGAQIIQDVHAFAPGLPVVAMSGQEAEALADLPVRALQKPFSSRDLLGTVGDVLGRRWSAGA